mgnify:CR=1 FL=1
MYILFAFIFNAIVITFLAYWLFLFLGYLYEKIAYRRELQDARFNLEFYSNLEKNKQSELENQGVEIKKLPA